MGFYQTLTFHCCKLQLDEPAGASCCWGLKVVWRPKGLVEEQTVEEERLE